MMSDDKTLEKNKILVSVLKVYVQFQFFQHFSFLFCRCDNKQECKMWVNSDVFGDPCPGTHKYVEVHFACAPRVLATTTKRPLPPWFLQGGADNLWNNPKKLSPTTSTTTFVSLILAPYSKQYLNAYLPDI